MTQETLESQTKHGFRGLAKRLVDSLTKGLFRNRLKRPLTLELMQKNLVYVIKNYPISTRYIGEYRD